MNPLSHLEPRPPDLQPQSSKAGLTRAAKDHIKLDPTPMICGIPVILGLGSRLSDPCAYVVFWAPTDSLPPKDQIGECEQNRLPRTAPKPLDPAPNPV